MTGTVRLHPDDDVVVALTDLAPGAVRLADGASLTLPAPVPRGHKVAVRPVLRGAPMQRIRSEELGFGLEEVVPWQLGATL